MTGDGATSKGYNAFISYSHTDERVAAALQRSLQRLAKPWYRIHALRVFRDDDNLANEGLWSAVQDALDQSEWLIVLASPTAASSEWVQRECEHWRAKNAPGRLLVGWTDGRIVWDGDDFDWDQTDALPSELSGAFAEEPRFTDLRWARDDAQLRLKNERFRAATTELAARLHGVGRDQLASEDRRLQRRALRMAQGAVFLLAVLAIGAAVATVVAFRARSHAQREARVALSGSVALEAENAFADGSAGSLTARPDLGTLLGIEAYDISPTEEARGAVLDALEYTDGVDGYLHADAGTIADLAYSPDGQTIALLTENHGVELWDTATRTEIGSLALPPGWLDPDSSTELAFSADGRILALTGAGPYPDDSKNGYVLAWDLETRRPTGPPIALPGMISTSAIVSLADGRFAIGTYPGGIEVWNPTETKPDVQLGARCPSVSFGGAAVSSLTSSRNGTRLAAGCANGTVRLWDPSRRFMPSGVIAAPGRNSAVTAIALSPTGSMLAVGYRAGTFSVFRLGTSNPTLLGAVPSDGDGRLYGLSFAPDGTRVAAVYNDGKSRTFDANTGKQTWSYGNTPDPLYTVAYSPDGSHLAVGGDDGVPVLFDGMVVDSGGSQLSQVLERHGQETEDVAFSPDAGFLATAGDGVRLWRLPSGTPLTELAGGRAWSQVAVSPNGQLLAAAELAGSPSPVIRLWDVAQPERPRALAVTLHPDGLKFPGSIALSPNGGVLAAVDLPPIATGVRPSVQLFDTHTGKLLRQLPARASSVAFSPDGSVLATGIPGAIELWRDYTSGRPHARFLGQPSRLQNAADDLAFSPEGDVLASSGDGTTLLWDLRHGTMIGQVGAGGFESVVGSTSAISFTDDGKLLAIGDAYGFVQLFDVATEQPLGRSLPFSSGVSSLAVSQSGGLMAAGGSGSITLWNRFLWSTPAQYALRRARLCALAGRNLTHTEWNTYVTGLPYQRICPQWP